MTITIELPEVKRVHPVTDRTLAVEFTDGPDYAYPIEHEDLDPVVADYFAMASRGELGETGHRILAALSAIRDYEDDK